MFDYYLKFDSEEQAMSVLYTKEGIELDEEGNVINEGYLKPSFDCIDIISSIYEPVTEEDQEPVALDGFHVNVRNYTETDSLNEYVVYPSNPRRVWA